MLLQHVMAMAEFHASVILEAWNFKNLLDMGLMDQARGGPIALGGIAQLHCIVHLS